jgi:CubicO group peptidase (beta-lactamase class C family)
LEVRKTTQIKTVQVSTLETKFEKMMTNSHVLGAAVAIIKDGKVIMSKGFGYRNIEKKEPITTQTTFPIASTTKAFATFALSLLTQRNKFDWDAPVQSYLPSFSLSDELASA